MWNKIISNEVKWLYKAAKNKKRYVGVLILIQTLLSVCGVIYALLLRNVIDEATKRDRKGFLLYLGIIIAIVVVQIGLRALDRYLEEYLRTSIENACKKRLFSQLLRKDFSSVTNIHTAEWMNRLTSDTVVCANGIVEILPRLIGLIVKMVCAFAMILILEPMFAWILIPGGILMFFITYVFRKVLKKMHRDIQEKDGSLRMVIQEHLSSLLVLKAFSAEDESRQNTSEKMHEHQQARLRRTRFSNICNTGFAAVMNGMYLIGGVGYCGYGILMGTISYGTFTAILQLIGQIQTPFANLTGFLPRFYAMVASAERLMEVESFSEDCENTIKTMSEVRRFYEEEFKAFCFENVYFSYQPVGENGNATVALENFSLKIDKGDYVALTGHSGSGKSTVLKLLMSLYPLDSGNCYLLGKSGCESLTAIWRRLFAYVPQGNYLMSGTIREIVSFGERGSIVREEEVRKALEIACAWEFVKDLDEGMETNLGENGQGLSEGQMQRIAIARAIFFERPVLLLDEATSALDEETEQKVLENLKKMTNMTVVIVTHRPKALEICNKIVHFDEQGMSVER